MCIAPFLHILWQRSQQPCDIVLGRQTHAWIIISDNTWRNFVRHAFVSSGNGSAGHRFGGLLHQRLRIAHQKGGRQGISTAGVGVQSADERHVRVDVRRSVEQLRPRVGLLCLLLRDHVLSAAAIC